MRIGKRIAAAGAAIVMACGLGLTACSPEESGEAQETSAAPAAVEAEEGAFPVTIEHAFGETTIEKAPERVVALGWSDVDPVLALGVTPVWAYDLNGDFPGAWQQDLVQGEGPALTEDYDIDYEQIAAAEPDLIIAMSRVEDDNIYDRLTQIAPTVTQREGYAGQQQPWQETMEIVGAALGRPEAAAEAIAELEGRIAEVAQRHPDWAGKTMAIAIHNDHFTGAYSSADDRTRLPGGFGLVVPEEIDSAAEGDNAAPVSPERADLFDADVLLFVDNECDIDAIREDPMFGALDVVREDRAVCVLDELGEDGTNAWNIASAPGWSYVLEDFEEMLERLLG